MHRNMQYEGNVIRPPSEAHSIILQVTTGCSHNTCTFCGAYKDKPFRIREEALILADLAFAAKYCQRQNTVFLADGNALAIPQEKLVQLMSLIRKKLPHIRRISLYANSQDIVSRSLDDLLNLKELGLGRIYMGLESGHDSILKMIGKGVDSKKMIRAGRLAREAGLFLSVTVLLGIGGMLYSNAHAIATASVLNEMKPSQIAVLTLMILDDTPLGRQYKNGQFQLPDRNTLFTELRTLLTHLGSFRTQFQSNHASNYFTLDGRLPKDKDKFIELVDLAIKGSVNLKPESLRAL